MLNYLRGREARPAAARWIIFKTLFFTVLFWLIFFYLLPVGIYALEETLGLTWWRFDSVSGRWIAVILFVLGGVLGIGCSMLMSVQGAGTPLPFDCPRRLVIIGPYRYVRNPMALAGLAQGVAVGIFIGSPAVILYALTGGPTWNLFVRKWEEADLEHRFGEPYRHYRANVWCWLPRMRGYSGDGKTSERVST